MSDKKIFIIAEIGSNHNGSLELAKKNDCCSKKMWMRFSKISVLG